MRRVLYILSALMLSIALSAQEKAVQSNFVIGAGLFGETGSSAENVFPGAVLRLSYGLDVKVSETWSVMPGAGYRIQLGEINHIGWVGGDPTGMEMADIFCQARYHIGSGGHRTVIGLGPQFSYMTMPDTYYIDADPNDPRNGKETFEKWDVALQPCIVFRRGKHWQWGLEASVGLRNMLRQYSEYSISGTVRLHNIMIICGWRF